MLVVGAGLIVQSLWRLMQVEPGISQRTGAGRQSVAVRGALPHACGRCRFPPPCARARPRAARRPLRRRHRVPAAGRHHQHVGLSDRASAIATDVGWLPAGDGRFHRVDAHPSHHRPNVHRRRLADAPRVVLISETLRRTYFANQEAIGRRLRLLDPTMEWRTIVGVVGDVRHDGLASTTGPAIYVPVAQTPFTVLDMSLVVRAATVPESVIGAIREAVRTVDRDQPVNEIETMARIVEATPPWQPRFHSALLSGFAFAALVLACVGIYGVMAQTVASRARELAVRAAMGATQDALQGLILRQAAIVTGIGLLAGLLGMNLLTRLLGTMLYEVSPTDPKTSIAAALAVVAVALLAAFVPARRAGRVDPVALLRQE